MYIYHSVTIQNENTQNEIVLTCIHTHTHTNMYICMYIYLYNHYIYKYMYIHKYTHTVFETSNIFRRVVIKIHQLACRLM